MTTVTHPAEQSTEQTIAQKVTAALQPLHLELHNESHMHAGPRTDSHFKLVAVAAAFDGLSKVKRHQLVYGLVATELAGPVHALALHLYTPAEWQSQTVPASPQCAGNRKTQ